MKKICSMMMFLTLFFVGFATEVEAKKEKTLNYEIACAGSGNQGYSSYIRNERVHRRQHLYLLGRLFRT